MERLYDWLLAAGYPKQGIDWLRRHRLSIIIVLAALSWVPVVALVWFLVSLIR